MAELVEGARAMIMMMPGDVYRVKTAGKARVWIVDGENPSPLLAAGARDVGPFDSPARLRVAAIEGPATYQRMPSRSGKPVVLTAAEMQQRLERLETTIAAMSGGIVESEPAP